MANLTVNVVTEKKMVETEVQIKKYNLELTAEELVVLYHLSGSVAGSGRVKDACDSIHMVLGTKSAPIFNYLFDGGVEPTKYSNNTLDKSINNMK